MNAQELAAPVAASDRSSRPWMRGLWRAFCFIWKFAIGVVCCQSLLASLVLVGWCYRAMQRAALKAWWKASPQRLRSSNFKVWAAESPGATPYRDWPNWFVRQNGALCWRDALSLPMRQRLRLLASLPLHSLWHNFKIGLLGAFNTTVLTLPAGLLWLFAWYDGWNNSFSKGYEQAAVGPLVGIAGIVLFIGAMLYVPWAQARQAATGQWRSFYHFSLVWGLARRHWLAGALLAALYSLCMIPVVVLQSGLMFAPIRNPAIEQFTDAQALHYLNQYFFRAGIALFPLYLLTKIFAARIYARAILHGLQRGSISVHQLSSLERKQLRQLDLIQVDPPRSRHVLARFAVGAGAGTLRFGGLFVIGLLWFIFTAQIFIAEFFKYNPIVAWLNQPLIQLPWFRHIPARLENQSFEVVFLALVLGLIGLALWLRKLLPRPVKGSTQRATTV